MRLAMFSGKNRPAVAPKGVHESFKINLISSEKALPASSQNTPQLIKINQVCPD